MTNTTNSAVKSIEATAVKHIQNALNEMDDDELLQVFRSANSYDGSFDFCDAWDIDEVVETLDKYEIARSIIYGNVTNICEPVRFNGYGNLENVSEWQLHSEARNNVEELAWWLLDNATQVDVDLVCYAGEIVRNISERWAAASVETIEAVAAMF